MAYSTADQAIQAAKECRERLDLKFPGSQWQSHVWQGIEISTERDTEGGGRPDIIRYYFRCFLGQMNVFQLPGEVVEYVCYPGDGFGVSARFSTPEDAVVSTIQTTFKFVQDSYEKVLENFALLGLENPTPEYKALKELLRAMDECDASYRPGFGRGDREIAGLERAQDMAKKTLGRLAPF